MLQPLKYIEDPHFVSVYWILVNSCLPIRFFSRERMWSAICVFKIIYSSYHLSPLFAP